MSSHASSVKLGLGLYREMLTAQNLQFARQAGATHIVAHLVSYFSRSDELNTAGSLDEGWGVSVPEEERWTYEGLRDLRLLVEGEGLELAAIENFEPAHWYDVLLDGPRKVEQLEKLATIVRNAGRAGVPTIGYNFSIAGVWGRTTGSSARGGAQSVGFNDPEDLPMPLGMVQNMIYDIELYRCAAGGAGLGEVSAEQMRSRLSEFLETLVPVARDAGVRLAMHPDDPPISRLRGTARVAWCPEQYEQAVDLVRDPHSAMELCLGTVSEMPYADVYALANRYASEGRAAYVHFRNVRGKAPHYDEAFIDDGDVDMGRLLRSLIEAGYEGVVIPDHTPQLTCDAPWHAGMAYTLGWLRGVLCELGR